MYKLILISDTHIKTISELSSELISLLKNSDMVIHAGDFVTKQAYDELSEISNLEAVKGNMDEPNLKKILTEKKVIDINGIKIGIIHIPSNFINDTIGARYMAKELGVDVLVFGHIHRPIIEKTDVFLLCPGSPTYPRLSKPTVIELKIEEKEISGKIIELGESCCFQEW